MIGNQDNTMEMTGPSAVMGLLEATTGPKAVFPKEISEDPYKYHAVFHSPKKLHKVKAAQELSKLLKMVLRDTSQNTMPQSEW